MTKYISLSLSDSWVYDGIENLLALFTRKESFE